MVFSVTCPKVNAPVVDYCRETGIGVFARGMRILGKLRHQLPMAQTNRHLSGIECSSSRPILRMRTSPQPIGVTAQR